MKTFKMFSYSVISLLVFSFVLYLYGCSSAESTTGKLAFQQKDYEKAERELKKGLVVDKSDAEGWYMLGVSEIEIGKNEDAKNSFRTSLNLSNKFADNMKAYWIDKYNAGINLFNTAAKYIQQKDMVSANKTLTEAIKYFTAASSVLPDSVQSYQMIGDSYSLMGKEEEALNVYNGILDKSKSKEDAIRISKILYQSGMKAREKEDWERASGLFKKASEINFLPTDNVYYENSIFNLGFSKYNIAAKIAAENKGEFKPLLQEVVNILEPLSKSSKDKTLLVNTYEILYNAYDGLNMKDKAADALNKKQELQK